MFSCVGWTISFSFFLKVSGLFPVRSKSLSEENFHVDWNKKCQVLGFTFVRLQNWRFERSQRGDILIPCICLKNSAWYSPIIFGLRGMNSYDACYWYPRYFYNRKKTSHYNKMINIVGQKKSCANLSEVTFKGLNHWLIQIWSSG